MDKIAKLLANVRLKPHQQEGIDKAKANRGSVLLDWRMGSGKTLGSAAIFEHLKERHAAQAALVVVPSTLKANYLKNIHKFTDSHAAILGSKQESDRGHTRHITDVPKGKDYYIVSNEMFKKDPERYIKMTGVDTVILDEAHKYKDPTSQNYKGMMKARPMVKHMIALTGTPISNEPRDIIPLMDMVTNKTHRLGDYKQFDRQFLRKTKVTKGPLAFIGVGVKGTETHLKNTHKLRPELHKHISSYHDESPDQPRKKVEDIEVPMSSHQNDIYKWAMHQHIDPITRLKIKYNLPIGQKEAAHIFAAIIKARQASNSIHMFHKGMTLEDAADQTPKAKRLLSDVESHLKANPAHKAIIYTNLYHGGVDVISAGLKKKGIAHGTYVGSKHIKDEVRQQGVKDYLAGNHRVMLLNSAGAEGLDLPGTSGHFAFDGHFNPAIIKQSEGRGIRVGSPVKTVHVKRYKSVLPSSWLAKKLGIENWNPVKSMRGSSIDQYVYNTAQRKETLNNEMQGLMK